jgi:protease I
MGTEPGRSQSASSPAFDGASLEDRRVAFLIAAEGAEQAEVLRPWEAVSIAGGRPVLVCPHEREAQLFDRLDRGTRFPVDVPLAEAAGADYDALMLPGGLANADGLRTDPEAVRFVRSFFASGKPVAAICQAPWLLVEADLVHDRALTSSPSLRTDIVNAGGTWLEDQVVVSESGPNVLVTSGWPQDLPAFCHTMVQRFAGAIPG